MGDGVPDLLEKSLAASSVMKRRGKINQNTFEYIRSFCILVFGKAKAVITRLESFVSRVILSETQMNIKGLGKESGGNTM